MFGTRWLVLVNSCFFDTQVFVIPDLMMESHQIPAKNHLQTLFAIPDTQCRAYFPYIWSIFMVHVGRLTQPWVFARCIMSAPPKKTWKKKQVENPLLMFLFPLLQVILLATQRQGNPNQPRKSPDPDGTTPLFTLRLPSTPSRFQP